MGRPKSNNVKKKISFRLDEKIYNELLIYCKLKNITVTEYLVKMLEREFEVD